ncbi:hypothetical protein CKM354_000836600 [Cercospora kikuchii]|uniref:Uncharacterized protein n=1 Tax=Cercospora kikuchii TaxID=84275 RepID=A0A9P3CMQ9_9PEZI|nr:uncharacterized protein CKM354_000836600 [Cercospora kikuchii]GIZ45186.1 hypothetical protein CKM354_000836600 [Cercospora kikuchii]
MPTSRIEMTWAVPVKIEQLGPHLEAYTSLQPALNTLRLCNRFGAGPKAAITKLPIELIQNIERYMVQEKQEKLAPAWTREFRCWQNRCVPFDHVDDEEILDIYNNGAECDSDCSDCVCCGTASSVSRKVREWVAEYFAMADWDYWREEHDLRSEAWLDRVGRPTQVSRGRFDGFSSILMKHFGLQVWISHVQESRDLHYVDESTAYTTKAYLRLPQPTALHHHFKHHFVDCDLDPEKRPTEAGVASELSMPQALSAKQAVRFKRAFNALNIVNLSMDEAPDLPNDHESVPGDTGSGDTQHVPRNAEVKPKLTLFVRNGDDDDW